MTKLCQGTLIVCSLLANDRRNLGEELSLREVATAKSMAAHWKLNTPLPTSVPTAPETE